MHLNPVFSTRKIIFVVLLMTANHLPGQAQSIFPEDKMHYAIGFTGASFNNKESISSGLSFYIGRDILQMKNSSFSLSTNLKLGVGDQSGAGILIPLYIALLAWASPDNSALSDLNLGQIHDQFHLFTEIPLLLHYNFGWGSREQSDKKMGFYLGGGMSFTTTAYTDTSNNSQGTSFFGWMIDGGIRFHKGLDINITNTIPLKQSIGQISRPMFYELTVSKYFP